MPDWKAAGPDSLLDELLKSDHSEFTRLFNRKHDTRQATCGERVKGPLRAKIMRALQSF